MKHQARLIWIIMFGHLITRSTLIHTVVKKKDVNDVFFLNRGGRIYNIRLCRYKVQFIIIILIIYFMNTFVLALILSSLDTFFCYKMFLRFNKNLKYLVVIFLTSFYIFSVLINIFQNNLII